MNRRAILAGAAGLCVSLAGCAATDDSDDDQPTTGTTATTTADPTPSHPVLVGQSLAVVDAGDCPASGRANVPAIVDGVVGIEGCLWAADGCSALRLAGVTYDKSSNTATVVVQTVEDAAPDEECAQALTSHAYRVELRFEYQLPEMVVVVHDDVNGRRTVAEREINT